MNFLYMEHKNLYDTIFKRKSIRKFDLTPLDDKILSDIARQLKKIIPIQPDIETEINIVSPGDVKGLIQVKAPYYIVAFSEVKEGYLTNIGFMLQQMDLFFSSNGIGCCWQGWPKPTKELRNNRNLEFVIVLAFGLPKEKLYRESIHEFKRKSLGQITDTEGFDELIEPARLAPSPSQPWFFTGEGETIHICCIKTRGIKAKIKSIARLNRIEIGIAICHLWIAAFHFNKKIDFFVIDDEKSKIPKGYFYLISISIQ